MLHGMIATSTEYMHVRLLRPACTGRRNGKPCTCARRHSRPHQCLCHLVVWSCMGRALCHLGIKGTAIWINWTLLRGRPVHLINLLRLLIVCSQVLQHCNRSKHHLADSAQYLCVVQGNLIGIVNLWFILNQTSLICLGGAMLLVSSEACYKCTVLQ
jgi:hypothetical protein